MADFYIKRGDRLPKLQATLKNPDGSVVDLTGATVKFRMFPAGGATAKVDGDGAIEGAATQGNVSYSWQGGDTDTAGEFNGEWEVTFNSGLAETFPNYDYMKILVVPDLK